MNLTTRCPHCGTLFKLVRDQLKISDGWVRCGICAEVFDAAVADPMPELPLAPQTTIKPDTVPSTEPAIEPMTMPEPSAEPAPTALKLVVADPPHKRLLTPKTIAKARVRAVLAAEASAAEMLEPEPEFVVSARRKGFWRSRSMRSLMLLLCLALLGLLAVQVALHERDRLAAQFPQLTPYLSLLCEHAGCQLAPVRQIDAVVIDSSGFSKTESGAYQLSFVLKNTASITLAIPALELTLTDRQDQPVLRRVVLPAEFGATSSVLQPQADFSGRLLLNLSSADVANNIAGYRVLAFYP